MANTMDIHKLKVFCGVVETGSFSSAAMKVRLKQPVVSAHVRDLERNVGLPLIDRTKRPVAPTEAGRLIYESAKKIFEGINEVESIASDLKKGQRGDVYVSTTSMLGNVILPEIVLRFRNAHPEINIHVNVGNPEKIFNQILTGVSHLGVLISEKPARPFAALPAGFVNLVMVQKFQLGSQGSNRPVNRLLKEKGVVAPHKDVLFLKVIRKPLRRFGIENLPVRYEVGSWEAAKRTVLQGTGITILPREWVVNELAHNQLEELQLSQHPVEAPIYIVRKAGAMHTTPVKKVQRYLIAELSNISSEKTPTRSRIRYEAQK